MNTTLFCGMSTHGDTLNNLVDHEILYTCCHIERSVVYSFIQISLVPQTVKVACKMNLDHLPVFNQSHNLCIPVKAPQAPIV